MPSPLVPSLGGDVLNIKSMMNYPGQLNTAIAKLTADQLFLDLFFDTAGGKVSGGGVNYSVLLSGTNFTTGDVERRSPGAEYPVVNANAKMDLAVVEDYGHKWQLLDEEVDRNDTISLANKMTAAANALTRKIDVRALAAIDAALDKHSIVDLPASTEWADVVVVGPEADLTPNHLRPHADLALANLFVQVEDLGLPGINALLMHPHQKFELTAVYGSDLDGMLKAAGVETVRTSVLVPRGTAYAMAKGQAGKVAFERPLTTEKYDDRATRSTWYQSYCLPAFAVHQPGAVRKITGIGTGA